eukprot:6176546-Pleurochrysis_carterae.AAC.1
MCRKSFKTAGVLFLSSLIRASCMRWQADVRVSLQVRGSVAAKQARGGRGAVATQRAALSNPDHSNA